MKKNKRILLIFITLFALNASAGDTLKLRVMTYNVRFGELATVDQLAGHIKAFKPDFVALQEVDVNTNRALAPHQNGRNLLSELAGKTGMFGLYGKAIPFNKGYYGIGILSKYPYVYVNKLTLPNPRGAEPRVLLEGLFEIGAADTIVFATTHLDVTAEETRVLQAKYITDYFRSSTYPVLLGGDFNAGPESKVIKEIMEPDWFDATGPDLTFPAPAPRIKIDYLFAYPRQGWKIINTQVVPSCLSDHLPVLTELEYVRK